MKRIIVRKPGGHAALELVEEKDPAPKAGEARVKVRAAGINYADCVLRMGRYEAAKGRYPLTPGFEFAGVVDRPAGDFKEGERVFGITPFGGYASSLCVSPRQLWRIPQGWSDADAAGFPAVFLTAYWGLFRTAKVEKGETVLVHSAAGGVGGAMIQLARIRGCRIFGVVGAQSKAEYARSLGAEQVVVRKDGKLWEEIDRLVPDGFDAIFDSGGVDTLRNGFGRLAPGGRLVAFGFADIIPRGQARPNPLKMLWNYLRVPKFSPIDMTFRNRGVLGFNVLTLFDRQLDQAGEAVREMLGWIGEGKIKQAPVAEFPLAEVGEAQAALESGTTQGKLILRM